MKNRKFEFTSESVSEGHPDKIADQISDAILDAHLSQDPNAKVACECLITTGRLIIAGEVTSSAKVNPVQIARKVIKNIGYTSEDYGFNYETAEYWNLMQPQSLEINKSVEHGGAGDQGIMFGYASNETKELMPLPITIAHEILRRQSELRKSNELSWLLPDAKSQVTINYENGLPKSIGTIVLSTQHKSGISQEEIRRLAIEKIINPVLENYIDFKNAKYMINPSGSFLIGGPNGDTGLTGRKIIVDTYGGSCPHGGGAFSGKDPSKVDRSAAYGARYVAKHLVEAGLAEKCTVQLSYAIGIAEPTSILVDTHGTGKVEEEVMGRLIMKNFDLTPNGMIKTLELKRPIYLPSASYGHFGNPDLPWEKINQTIINQLKNH